MTDRLWVGLLAQIGASGVVAGVMLGSFRATVAGAVIGGFGFYCGAGVMEQEAKR